MAAFPLPVAGERLSGRATRARRRSPLVWAFRLPLAVPFVLMGPELAAAVRGRPGAVPNLSASTADVLGTSTFLIFTAMLAVTPLHTLTGWRWHLVLRRDYGVAMFVTAVTDLALAATTTGDTFPGGLLTRVAGHTFLVVGTLSVLLLVPLAVTATLPARRWLGRHWKWLHRLTYVVWITILLHLLLLFGPRRFFLDAVAVSVPLGVLRIPRLQRWWARSRRGRTNRLPRWLLGTALATLFVVGYIPFVHELAHVGSAAFLQTPPHD
jgi:sulfoxide reductase heme-binding subunit YedZ